MKKLITSTFLLFVFPVFACDVCGSQSVGISTGWIPVNGYHIIGFRHTYRSTLSVNSDPFSSIKTESREQFMTHEVVCRWNIMKRFQLFATVPFVQNKQDGLETKKEYAGLGDISINGNYILWSKLDTIKAKQVYLSGGIGMKIPTGKSASTAHETNLMYSGSGSFDFPINTNILILGRRIQFNFESAYVMKMSNKAGYRYGNVFSIGQNALIRMPAFSSVTLSPIVGSRYSHFEKNRIYDTFETFSATAGYLFELQVGISCRVKNWLFMTNYYMPLIQQIGSNQVQQNKLVQINLFYLIQTK
jgi:hypothetical protein